MPSILALFACLTPIPDGGTTPTDPATTDPQPTDPQPTDPVPTGDTAAPTPEPPPTEAVFDAVGGEVDLAGSVTLRVPAGALDAATTLSVSCSPGGAPDAYVLLSEVCTFEPVGLTFAEPITVAIPFNPGGGEARFYWSSAGDGYAPLDAAVVGDRMEAEVLQLATGFVAEPGPVQEIHDVRDGVVDVLFVVDDSASMYEEQGELAGTFPELYAHLGGSGLDWHIGVTTTDVDSANLDAGKLERVVMGETTYRWVDEQTPNPTVLFGVLANAGIQGSPEERGRAAAYRVLETQQTLPRNAGFERDGDLHIVFLSDENDQSNANPSGPDGSRGAVHLRRRHAVGRAGGSPRERGAGLGRLHADSLSPCPAAGPEIYTYDGERWIDCVFDPAGGSSGV